MFLSLFALEYEMTRVREVNALREILKGILKKLQRELIWESGTSGLSRASGAVYLAVDPPGSSQS